MEKEPLRDLMTPEQVAEYLQMDTETVYRLIKRKELAASRDGQTYCISREDLEAFLLANSTHPQVRQALFNLALGYAERENPEGDGDAFLEELERLDEERRRTSP